MVGAPVSPEADGGNAGEERVEGGFHGEQATKGPSPSRPPRHRPRPLGRTTSTGAYVGASVHSMSGDARTAEPQTLTSEALRVASASGGDVPTTHSASTVPVGSVSSRSMVNMPAPKQTPATSTSAAIPSGSVSSRSLVDLLPTSSSPTSSATTQMISTAPPELPPIQPSPPPEPEAYFSPPASPSLMDLEPKGEAMGGRGHSASTSAMLVQRRLSETFGPSSPDLHPVNETAAVDSPPIKIVPPPAGGTTSLATKNPSVYPSPTKTDTTGQSQTANVQEKEPLWRQYLREVVNPGPTVASADAVWGATERDVMYNSLIFVPYQLERVLWFGLLICIDPFLAIFTTVPLRAAKGVFGFCRGLAWRVRAPPGPEDPLVPLLRGDQLYDILYSAIFAFAAFAVSSLNAGVIYFWMKDLSQEFIKLSVIFTAMEICDKILTSFGVSALHSLCCSCTNYANGGPGQPGLKVALDTLVATIITTTHAVALMSEAIAFSVAMNSRRTTLMALVISFNFVEVKGTVFKKFDPNKLMTIVYQDIVERFHMIMLMLFVIIEDMDTSDSWGSLNGQLMLQVGVILASELVADITKHAVVGKFNVIRPGVYREYMRDLCAEAAIAQPTSMNRVVEMEPIGTAAISFRMLLSFLWHCHEGLEGKPWWDGVKMWGGFLVLYSALVVLKLAWGYVIKVFASSYLVYYEGRFGKGGHRGATQNRQTAATKKDN